MAEQTDEDIALKVQSGNTQLFGVLVERYEAKIKRYAKKFLFGYDDIQDLIQDVFVKAYTNIKGFDSGRKFSSWLYRIAHNELVNNLKKKNKSFLPLFDLDTFSPHYYFNNDNVNEKIDRKNTMKLIDKCFDELNVKYKEPIILYYLENLSYKEIADVMSIPVSTVGIRIKRAKKIMRSIFEKKGYKHE